MRRLIKLSVVFLVILLVCTSCAGKLNKLKLTYDSNGVYVGFNNLPKDYTADQAQKDGCYVVDNSQQKGTVYKGQKEWEQFIENSSKNKKSNIRKVSIFPDDVYISDLFYDGEKYTLISSDEKEKIYQYKYLLDLKGTMPNAAKNSRFVYLTNDKELTFDEVSKSIFSSNSKDFLDGKFVIME